MPRPPSWTVIDPVRPEGVDVDLDHGRDARLFGFVERVVDKLLDDHQRPVPDRVADLLHKFALRHELGEPRDGEGLALERCAARRSRQMLPSDPAKLEARSGKRLDGDRSLGDRNHPAVADHERRAGEVDPCPDGRHAVKLLGRPSEKRRLIAPAVADEPLQAVLGLGPALRRAVVWRRGVHGRPGGFAARQDAQKVGLGGRENGDDVWRRRCVRLEDDAAPVGFEAKLDAWERARSSTVSLEIPLRRIAETIGFSGLPSLKNRLQIAPIHSGTQVQ